MLGQNQIVGRTLCVNFEANGNCSPNGRQASPPTARSTARTASASPRARRSTITDTLVSQNLVQGTGAPDRAARRPTTRTCALAAGVRLIGAAPRSVCSATTSSTTPTACSTSGSTATTANTARPGQGREQLVGSAPSGGNADQHRPGDLADDQPAVPENPVNGAAARRRHGHHVGHGRLLPVPQRPRSRTRTRASSRSSTSPGAGQRRRPDRRRSPTDKRDLHRGETVTLTAAAGRRLRRPRASPSTTARAMVGTCRPQAVQGRSTRSRRTSPCATRTLTAVVDGLLRPDDARRRSRSTIDSADCTLAGPRRCRASRPRRSRSSTRR